MRRIAALSSLLFLCACGSREIYVPNDPLPPSAQQDSLSQVESIIVKSGTPLDWKFQHAADGHLLATETDGKLSATVDIFFDRHSYRIAYNSSIGLREKDGKINRHYNSWITNLERSINDNLAKT